MKKFIYLFIFFFSLVSSNIKANERVMILKLTYGDVEIELYPNKAPNHVNRFKELANSGLEIVKSTNISSEVLRALDDFNEAKMNRFSKMFGSWLKKPLSEFAGMKGSSIYEDLSNGNTLYYHYLLMKN